MMARTGSLCTFALCFLVLAFTAAPQVPAQRVLFIGNSLTFANDLPGMVEALSAAGGNKRWTCESVAFPDFSLEDHWSRGDAAKAISHGGWSAVILQQGPSALLESRASLVEYTKKFDAEIRRAGGRTALYMVWPSASRAGDFDAVSASYRAAAQAVNGLLLPVGDAWRAARKRDPTLALYGVDGFHPTTVGTYLAAVVIYSRLSGRSPVGLPSTLSLRGGHVTLPQETAALLQEAAR